MPESDGMEENVERVRASLTAAFPAVQFSLWATTSDIWAYWAPGGPSADDVEAVCVKLDLREPDGGQCRVIPRTRDADASAPNRFEEPER